MSNDEKNATNLEIEKILTQNVTKVDLSHLAITISTLKIVKEKISVHSHICRIKWKESVLNSECKILMQNIDLRLIRNILSQNNTETDLSHFDVNLLMLQLVEKKVSIHSNIGIIKWKESTSKPDDECKSIIEKIENIFEINLEEKDV